MANAITKYTNKISFITKIPHLEGQEVFGSTKWKADVTLGSEADSHMHDCVNFSWPIVNATSSGFTGSNVDAGESSGIVRDETFVLIFQGLKVQERVHEDGVWRIERYPPLSNTHCSTIQRDLMKHYNAKIIVKRIVRGIPSLIWKGLH
jgi:hypothetical protein